MSDPTRARATATTQPACKQRHGCCADTAKCRNRTCPASLEDCGGRGRTRSAEAVPSGAQAGPSRAQPRGAAHKQAQNVVGRPRPKPSSQRHHPITFANEPPRRPALDGPAPPQPLPSAIPLRPQASRPVSSGAARVAWRGPRPGPSEPASIGRHRYHHRFSGRGGENFALGSAEPAPRRLRLAAVHGSPAPPRPAYPTAPHHRHYHQSAGAAGAAGWPRPWPPPGRAEG